MDFGSDSFSFQKLASLRQICCVFVLDSTHVLSRNHGECTVDRFRVNGWVVGIPEQCHIVRCCLTTRLSDCNRYISSVCIDYLTMLY
jgi:hypothetical protein